VRRARAAAGAAAVLVAAASAAHAAPGPDLDHNTTATGVAVRARVGLAASSAGIHPAPATTAAPPSVPTPAVSSSGGAPVLVSPTAPLLPPDPCVRRKLGGSLAAVYSVCADAPPPRQPGPRRAPRVDPETVARILVDRARARAPAPPLRIAPGEVGVTGLPSYFWVPPAAPIAASARVAGYSVTAIAEPVQHSWSFGDGTGLVTADGGRPWAPGRPGTVPHVYETPGRFEATVEQIWRARWRAGSGPWRDLGFFTVSGSRTYRVRAVVAFLVRP
jgi:hypothetical protein